MKNQMQFIRNCGLVILTMSCLLTGCSNAGKAGIKAMEEEDYKEAVTQFTQAASTAEAKGKKEDAAEAYRGLGMAYYELKEYDKSISDFSKSIELDPDELKAYQNRGDAYCNLGNYDEAIKDFAMVSQLEKNFK